jgi:hypothetical protein
MLRRLRGGHGLPQSRQIVAEILPETAGLRWNSLGDMDHFQVDA